MLLLVVGAAVVALAGSSGWASANSSVVYSQTEVQPIPPAQNYAASSGGDGYAVGLYNSRVYNVFHHQTNVTVDCHLQSDGSACWSQGPETVTDGSGRSFATPTQTGLYIDQSTGKLWVYATRSSDLTAGVVCIDTTIADTNRNPFCGFVALSAAGDAPIYSGNGKSDLSLPMLVASKWYAFNYAPGSGATGTKNKVLCFDLSTDAACSGQPYATSLGTGSVTTSCTCGGEAAIGSELIIPVSMTLPGRAELACFDTATLGNCAGTWPLLTPTIAINSYGAAYPILDTAGNTTGFCLPNSIDHCFTLAGVAISTPAGMATAITREAGTNGPAVVIGPRVYVPNSNTNSVACYDYSQAAGCPNFPLAFANLGSLYTVNADPQRPTCLWVNSDNGSAQIQSFDAYNGGPCVQTRVLAQQFVVPQQKCYPNSYQSLQIVSPIPSDYSGGSISFADAGGNPISGLSSVPLDATGTASLSGLNLNTPSGLPQFLIKLTNAPVAPAPLSVRLTWTATPDPACLSAGQTNPTATTLDATLSDGTNTNKTLTEWMGTPVKNNGSLSGTHAATATGFVTYRWWSDSACTMPAAPDSVQTITTPGTLPASAAVNLPAGVYYETVAYSGDSLNNASSTACGSEVLTVNPVPTNVTYTGDTSVYAGHSATISFVLKDSITGNTLANMPVTLTLPDGSTYPTTTDANGVASKTVTAPTTIAAYPVSESFGGQGKYLSSNGPGTLQVNPIPTSVTYTGDTSVYSGDPLTLSYVLTNALTGDPLTNRPVTISLPGGGSYSTTTDASGVASDTITAPAETSNTTLGTTESFAGQDQYLASSGPGSVLVQVIPTTITYTGDTSVYSGQPATLSYVLTDSSNNPLANEPVTITLPADLGGGTVTGATDANGAFSTTVTTPIVSSDTTEGSSESFAGLGRYLASSGPGSLVVHPIPTNVTYIGDTSVYSGDPLTVSYVLTNALTGDPLANRPVTISLPGGGSYSTTTDASGVASDTITAPAETSNTTLGTTESFAGQDQYLASSGPGSVLVQVIPTTITYTGDTSVYSGQPATLSFVLTDAGNTVLANKSVTITLPAAFGGGTVSGTTDANGAFSTTATAPIVSGDTTYTPSEAFAGQGKYLASNGPGSIVVHPIPTNITYAGDTSVSSGQSATLKFVLTDKWGNTLAGEPVTITLPAAFGGGTVSGTTNANGVFSATATAPLVSTDTTYTPSESFGGQAQYLASSGPGSIVVHPIPTNVSYTGDTTAYSGQQATLKFVLTDNSGNTLANMPVTISFNGNDYSATTNGSGIASVTVTSPIVSSDTTYAPTESFAGQAPYLASSGPGSLVVKPIPTNVTYTGDTSVYAASPATISFVLKNSLTGQVMANMPVTLTLPDGSTYATTTDANGVASKTVTAPGPSVATDYPVSESFGGKAQYLASNGPGTLTVKPIPTVTTYTGPTTGTTGATTTVTATLIAAPTSTPLGGKLVKITVGGISCTGTTNAAGTASCTIVTNLPAGSYPVTASFAGSGYYLASSGPGTFSIGAWNSGNGSMGFWKGPNGQKIIGNGPGMNGIAKLTTWLRTYAPFQDLSPTANCNADASYIATVINNAAGSNMNSMLKAQMLAAALDLFFSTPGLGGSQIGSSWSYGDNTYSLINVPGDGSAASAFNGATSMKLGGLLSYAASQSNVGGSMWYGNIKTVQTLAKDVFADISLGTLPIQ